jgi:DNA-binding HxlR family transcriptional regulator
MTEFKRLAIGMNLSPQSKLILAHLEKAGSISARDAMDDYDITSATLARRICDMEEAGIKIKREKRKHPISGKPFTRYSFA